MEILTYMFDRSTISLLLMGCGQRVRLSGLWDSACWIAEVDLIAQHHQPFQHRRRTCVRHKNCQAEDHHRRCINLEEDDRGSPPGWTIDRSHHHDLTVKAPRPSTCMSTSTSDSTRYGWQSFKVKSRRFHVANGYLVS